jgi:hypothetical protein
MKTLIEPDLIADVKAVATKLGTSILSRSEYFQHGRYTAYQVYDGGRIWEEVCRSAGLETKKKEPVSDDEYFSRLKQAYGRLGRYPKASERKKFGLNFSKRRYATLNEFIRKAVSLGFVPNLFDEKTIEADVIDSKAADSLAVHSDFLEGSKRPVPPIPVDTKRTKWERTGIEGFPYAPHDELGVVGLFTILCSKGKIRWQILEMRGGKGIDITCYDEIMDKTISVELKHTLSKGSWNHRLEDIDFVVCWENRWPDFPKPVLVLSEIIKVT